MKIEKHNNWPSEKEVTEFLKESNAIEGVFEDFALEDARAAWKYLLKQDRLTLLSILKAHKLLVQRIRPEIAGLMRMVDVRVGPRVCPSWELVYGLLSEWVKKYADPLHGSDILGAHIEFEKIHPFEDGNGRIGRMIMNWQRLKVGLVLDIIHSGKEQQLYYTLFDG